MKTLILCVFITLALTVSAWAQDARADFQAFQAARTVEGSALEHFLASVNALMKQKDDTLADLQKQIADLKTKCGKGCESAVPLKK